MPLIPPPLKKGGTIGVVSPSRWPKPEWLNTGKSLLEAQGYKVFIHPQNYLKDGQLAGSDAARIDAIMDMFADPTVDAIICARGGTGANRIVDGLDYKFIKKHPKPFVGFSDITVLLNAIQQRCGFATYHGPMLWNLAHPHHPRVVGDLLAVISGKKSGRSLAHSKVPTIRAGKVRGRLVGGNIGLLEVLMGTPFDWSAKDSILFLEDVDEPLYKIDRSLQHLRMAGKFKSVRAVLVGEMVDLVDGESGFNRKGERPYGRSLQEMFQKVLPPDVPLCMNFPCGHGKNITTLPLGAMVEVTLRGNAAKISF